MPLGHAKEAVTENEQGKAKERVDMPLLKFPAVPAPSRSPPSPWHAAPVTPKVYIEKQVISSWMLTYPTSGCRCLASSGRVAGECESMGNKRAFGFHIYEPPEDRFAAGDDASIREW